ncbi:MAG: DEAD/DEAH box helicase [Bacillota bacterium]|nr:DEAD/DEAH box helicase [Bacillota bacterium]
MGFEALGLNENIIKGLALQGVNKPTDVQVQSIPKITQNKDVVIQSETGSGKTLAYLLPVFERQDLSQRVMQVIVIVPTRELAMQVYHQVETLSRNSGIALRSCIIFGGVNIKSQIEKLREKPQIVIGTTGRLLELIKLKKITAHTIKTIVIDEADRMLDIDNIEDVKAIVKAVMRDTQIVMASASISDKTFKMAAEIAKKPELIKTTKTLKIPDNISHMFIVADQRDKIETLRKLVYLLKPGRAIAFINSAYETETATTKLKYHGISAECIHGGNSKEHHRNTLAEFANGKLKLLIASDIAARGLHIENIEIIFSLSIPEDPLIYLHRAGRTGRGESKGMSISVVAKRELPLIKKYQNTFDINIMQMHMRNGEITLSNRSI